MLPLLHLLLLLLLHLSYFILFVLFAFYFAPILSHPTCTKSYNFLSSLALVSKKKKQKKFFNLPFLEWTRVWDVCIGLGVSAVWVISPFLFFFWRFGSSLFLLSFFFYEHHARFPSTFPPRYECKGTKWARHKESRVMLPISRGYTRIYDRDFLAHFVYPTRDDKLTTWLFQ
jgi:hypothetical protein